MSTAYDRGCVRELSSRIEIDARPERVWSILTDFNAYPAWNPFITKIEGSLQPGSRLEVHIAPPGGRAMTFKPTVRTVEENRELAWLGHLLVPGVFDGEHHFELAPRPSGGTGFTQRERFSGILVSLTSGALGKTQRGFEQMNAALKERAEQNATWA
jgi:hypothetical protein